MKKKEIEVFINKNELASFGVETERAVIWRNYPATNEVLKARLIVELPEKKITITESEFDEAWITDGVTMETQEAMLSLKQKLFGEKE